MLLTERLREMPRGRLLRFYFYKPITPTILEYLDDIRVPGARMAATSSDGRSLIMRAATSVVEKRRCYVVSHDLLTEADFRSYLERCCEMNNDYVSMEVVWSLWRVDTWPRN